MSLFKIIAVVTAQYADLKSGSFYPKTVPSKPIPHYRLTAAVLKKFSTEKQRAIRALQKDGTLLADMSVESKASLGFAKTAVSQNGLALAFVSSRLKRDRQVVMMAVRKCGMALLFAYPELRQDKEVVMEALLQNGNAIRFVEGDLLNDPEIIQAALNHGGFSSLNKPYRDCKAFAYQAVIQNPLDLQHAGPNCKKDMSIALEAVARDPEALRFVDPSIKADPKLVETAEKRKQYLENLVVRDFKYRHWNKETNPRHAYKVPLNGTRFEKNDYPQIDAFLHRSPEHMALLPPEITALPVIQKMYEYYAKQRCNSPDSDQDSLPDDQISVDANGESDSREGLNGRVNALRDKLIFFERYQRDSRYLEASKVAFEEYRSSLPYIDDPEAAMVLLENNPPAHLRGFQKLDDAHLIALCHWLHPDLLDDDNFMKQAVAKFDKIFEFGSDRIKDDLEISKIAVSKNYQNLDFVSERLRESRELVMVAVASAAKLNASLDMSFPGKFSTDKALYRDWIEGSNAFNYLMSNEMQNPMPRCFCSDKDIALALIKKNPSFVLELSPDMRKDADVMLATLENPTRNNLDFLKYADISLLRNKAFMQKAMKLNVYAFEYASSSLKRDSGLKFSYRCRSSEAFMKGTPKKMRNDHQTMISALKLNYGLFNCIGEDLMKNRAFLTDLLIHVPVITPSLKIRLNDPDLWANIWDNVLVKKPERCKLALKYYPSAVINAIKENHEMMEYVPSPKRNNRNFVMQALSANGLALQYVPEPLSEDEEIILTAISQNFEAFKLLPETLQKNPNFALKAVGVNDQVLKVVLDSFGREITLPKIRFIEHALDKNGLAIAHVDAKRFKEQYEDFAHMAIQQNRKALTLMDPHYISNIKWVKQLIEKVPLALEKLSDDFRNNPEIVRLAVQKNPAAIKFAGPEITINSLVMIDLWKAVPAIIQELDVTLEDLFQRAIRQDLRCIPKVPEQLLKDVDFCLSVINWREDAATYFPEGILTDETFVLQLIAKDRKVLSRIKNHLTRDKQFLKKVAEQDGLCLGYMSPNFRDDPGIVLAAVKQNGLALGFASEQLQNQAQVASCAIYQNWLSINFVGEILRGSRDFLKEVLAYKGVALARLPHAFIDDRELNLTAVTQNGFAIAYVDDRFLKDQDIVAAAIQRNSELLKELIPAYLESGKITLSFIKAIILKLIQTKPEILGQVGFNLELTVNDAKSFLAQNGLALEFVDDELKRNTDIISAAIQQNPEAVSFIPDNVLNTHEDVLTLIKTCPSILEKTPEKWLGNQRFVNKCIQLNNETLPYISSRMPHEKIFLFQTLSKDPSLYPFIPESYKKNIKFNLSLVKKNGMLLEKLSPKLQNNKGIVLAALKNAPAAYKFASEKLQKDKDVSYQHECGERRPLC